MANNGGNENLFIPSKLSTSFPTRMLDSSSRKKGTEVEFSNDDILIEILSRLPTKVLLGLKCVSKGWCRLISDPTFVWVQLRRSNALSGFFFQERFQWCDEDIESVSFIPVGMELVVVQQTVLDFLPEKVVLTASSNGLVCCRSCLPASDPAIYICNPSNKKWVKIKRVIRDKGFLNNLALVFDPLCHPVDISTDFRVVSVRQTFVDTEEEAVDIDSYFSFEIYNSRTEVWKMSEEICYCDYNLFKNKGIFTSGVLHWLTDGNELLTFNVENERSLLVKLPIPMAQDKDLSVMCIGESEGRLHYIQISMGGLQVWILEEYYEPKWVLKCSIDLAIMEEENPQVLYNALEKVARQATMDMIPWMDPLAFHDGFLFLRVSTKVYLYHIETRKMEELCNLAKLGPNSLSSPVVLPYSMSLVTLGHS